MPIRASNIVVVYFVIGAVMFGGGAITFDDSGVTQFFLEEDDDELTPDNQTSSNLQGLSGTITNLISQVGGPALLVWNLITGIAVFLNWPIVVLVENNAPPSIVLLLGGAPTVMFYMALIRLVRTSA